MCYTYPPTPPPPFLRRVATFLYVCMASEADVQVQVGGARCKHCTNHMSAAKSVQQLVQRPASPKRNKPLDLGAGGNCCKHFLNVQCYILPCRCRWCES